MLRTEDLAAAGATSSKIERNSIDDVDAGFDREAGGREIGPDGQLVASSATLKTYAGGSHGLADTIKDQLNADLLAFLKS